MSLLGKLRLGVVISFGLAPYKCGVLKFLGVDVVLLWQKLLLALSQLVVLNRVFLLKTGLDALPSSSLGYQFSSA
ncbi:hypothetical protein GBA52_029015 [Prunus armeniaca]|nr:hypothetical protein GBA52_029015 [Prunus armeniaca]